MSVVLMETRVDYLLRQKVVSVRFVTECTYGIHLR